MYYGGGEGKKNPSSTTGGNSLDDSQKLFQSMVGEEGGSAVRSVGEDSADGRTERKRTALLVFLSSAYTPSFSGYDG